MSEWAVALARTLMMCWTIHFALCIAYIICRLLYINYLKAETERANERKIAVNQGTKELEEARAVSRESYKGPFFLYVCTVYMWCIYVHIIREETRIR